MNEVNKMSQKRIPLYEALVRFKENNPISFHVPGHKNGLLYQQSIPEFSRFMKYDMTELSGLDDMHSPDGPILEAQQLLTNYYETRKSYFLVNGSTVGNLIMILSTFKEGDKVLVQRNCHKSILNALMLAKVNPIFISPEIDGLALVPNGIISLHIEQAYHLYSKIKGCILTYPNYYGMTTNIEEIIQMVHRYHGIVLVDEAHGPHFRLGHPFPKSAVDLGADMIVQSAHKMLPAMTMGSYLHINSDRVSLEKVEQFYSILQSSSPSYPIMASLDFARYYLATYGQEDIEYTMKQRNQFVDNLNSLEGMTVIQGLVNQDPLKLMVRYNGYSGFQFQELLEEEGVYTEMADPHQVVMVLPLLKKGAEFIYIEAFEKMKEVIKKPKLNKNNADNKMVDIKNKISHLAIPFSEMEDRSYEWVPFKHAVNRIAAKMIIPYPPGIPLTLPGECITDETIEVLDKLLTLNARFQGEIERLTNREILVYVD